MELSGLCNENINWLAGILEGEASFQFDHTFRIQVGQKERELPDRLQALYGGKVFSMMQDTNLKKNAKSYRWHLYGGPARELMGLVYPMLTTRRQGQIDKALDKAEEIGYIPRG